VAGILGALDETADRARDRAAEAESRGPISIEVLAMRALPPAATPELRPQLGEALPDQPSSSAQPDRRAQTRAAGLRRGSADTPSQGTGESSETGAIGALGDGAVTVPDPKEGAGGGGAKRSEIDLVLHPKPGVPPAHGASLGLPEISAEVGGSVEGPVLQPGGGGSYVFKDTHFKGMIGEDGTVEFEGRGRTPNVGISERGMPALSIPLDVNDAILGLAGEDPYGYEKRKFLAATGALRAEMAEAACKERLSHSLVEIKDRLDAVWRDTTLSLAERRGVIFQLWDECAEEGTPEVTRTAQQIRELILGYINRHLPPQSVFAYSGPDLEALNRQRKSSQVFAPYALAPDSGVITVK
jgi:hypothetical protein